MTESFPLGDEGRSLLDLIAAATQVAAGPPRATAVLAHHGVPYGRAFRQWDTRGRLFLWVNRGQIADLPRGRRDSWHPAESVYLDGLPVLYVGRDALAL